MTLPTEEPMRIEPMRTSDGGASKQEQHIIERLAEETQSPEHEARRTYLSERERLDNGARVKTYVPIIAARRARESLKKKVR